MLCALVMCTCCVWVWHCQEHNQPVLMREDVFDSERHPTLQSCILAALDAYACRPCFQWTSSTGPVYITYKDLGDLVHGGSPVPPPMPSSAISVQFTHIHTQHGTCLRNASL